MNLSFGCRGRCRDAAAPAAATSLPSRTAELGVSSPAGFANSSRMVPTGGVFAERASGRPRGGDAPAGAAATPLRRRSSAAMPEEVGSEGDPPRAERRVGSAASAAFRSSGFCRGAILSRAPRASSRGACAAPGPATRRRRRPAASSRRRRRRPGRHPSRRAAVVCGEFVGRYLGIELREHQQDALVEVELGDRAVSTGSARRARRRGRLRRLAPLDR